MEVLGPLLWALFVTCLILVLAYWFTRYVAGHMMTGALGRGKHITVLEQVSVGKEQRLLLVRIGNRTYFLSATPGGIQNLGELSQEETAGWEEPASPASELTEGFSQVFRRLREQRKR